MTGNYLIAAAVGLLSLALGYFLRLWIARRSHASLEQR